MGAALFTAAAGVEARAVHVAHAADIAAHIILQYLLAQEINGAGLAEHAEAKCNGRFPWRIHHRGLPAVRVRKSRIVFERRVIKGLYKELLAGGELCRGDKVDGLARA